MTDDPALRQALAYARRGWPVFPCQPGQKVPATRHGYKDATTDEQQITGWFGRDPGRNVAIATGAPGPDVLDVDVHGAAGNGYAALGRLHCAGLLEDAYGYVRTPSGGLHIYFTGTAQRNGHLAAHHVDFRSAGGYVLAPPSQVDGHPYLPWGTPGRDGTLSWERVCRALPSQPQRQRPGPRPAQDRDLDTLARWLARQPEGNRNAGLYWAANRALETDPGRRPEPAGRRRPPGRPRRPGNQQDPGLRPPDRPGPPRTARLPGRGGELKMSINPPAGPVPRPAGPPYPAPARARPALTSAGCARTAAPTAPSRTRRAWTGPPSRTWPAAAAGPTAAPPPRCSP